MQDEDKYYLQDSRSYVGNDMLWWGIDGCGYTSDLRKAHVYTREQAVKHNQDRYTDIPWPKSYVDSKTRPAVDMQYVKINDALKKTGIKLKKPDKRRREVFNCCACGRFMSEAALYEPCVNCGESNIR